MSRIDHCTITQAGLARLPRNSRIPMQRLARIAHQAARNHHKRTLIRVPAERCGLSVIRLGVKIGVRLVAVGLTHHLDALYADDAFAFAHVDERNALGVAAQD